MPHPAAADPGPDTASGASALAACIGRKRQRASAARKRFFLSAVLLSPFSQLSPYPVRLARRPRFDAAFSLCPAVAALERTRSGVVLPLGSPSRRSAALSALAPPLQTMARSFWRSCSWYRWRSTSLSRAQTGTVLLPFRTTSPRAKLKVGGPGPSVQRVCRTRRPSHGCPLASLRATF